MKKLFLPTLFKILLLSPSLLNAQPEKERLDLPGDNFSLYAALKLFQKSTTPEDFEKALNDKNTMVNNLDLDGNGQVDYIRVYDNVSGQLHVITLKIAVGDSDDQDVATIFVEKKEEGKVLLQVVGDEELYGKDYIIEPYAQEPAPGKSDRPTYISTSRQASLSENAGSTVVAGWPVVKYIFLPRYDPWASPWRWRYYPSAWQPWKPQYWHYYYGYHYHWQHYYNFHFRKWKYLRNPAWYGRYNGNLRTKSIIVRTRKGRGDYRATYAQPLLAGQGSAYFKSKHPQSPGAAFLAPAFDQAGRPLGIKRTITPKAAPAKKATAKKKKTGRPAREHAGAAKPRSRTTSDKRSWGSPESSASRSPR